jgi:deoxyribonuclease V
MKIRNLHSWKVDIQEAVAIQKSLASNVIRTGNFLIPQLVAGLDVSVSNRNQAKAAVVVLKFPELEISEVVTVEGTVDFPYVPGLLSFREIPISLEACQQIRSSPELIIVDGQGIAHPRRIGLASHLGLVLDIPSIGCAKSLLIGSFDEVDNIAGSYSYIKDNDGEVIGAALRTKNQVKPVFASIGNKVDLSTAIHWVLQCCRGYRLPEPTRLAHLASKGQIN